MSRHTYQKDPFNLTTGNFTSNGSTYDARSGLHSHSNIKLGPIPNGDYELSSISNTGGIKRFNLTPQQDIGSRSHLQIHQKSDNSKTLQAWTQKGALQLTKMQ